MKTIEVASSDLRVGQVLVAKGGAKKRYKLIEKGTGLNGGPYLTLEVLGSDQKVEHDTSFDSYGATYTVEDAG